MAGLAGEVGLEGLPEGVGGCGLFDEALGEELFEQVGLEEGDPLEVALVGGAVDGGEEAGEAVGGAVVFGGGQVLPESSAGEPVEGAVFLDGVGESEGTVAVVASEGFVAAIACEGDGDVLAGDVGEVPAGQGGGVGEGFVVEAGELVDGGVAVWGDEVLVVVAVEAAGGVGSVGQFVVEALGEADGAGLDGVVGGVGHEAYDDGGVDAAGEEGAEGDVADHAEADGVGEGGADGVGGVVEGAGEGGFLRG